MPKKILRHKWVRDEDVSICDLCWYVLDKRDEDCPDVCPGKPPEKSDED